MCINDLLKMPVVNNKYVYRLGTVPVRTAVTFEVQLRIIRNFNFRPVI